MLSFVQRGLESMQNTFAAHTKRYGLNTITKRLRFNCKMQMMPMYYVFLFGIAGVVMFADYYLYEYKYWYIQGITMAVMVIIAALVFGCDRIRQSKRDSLSTVGYEPAEVDENMLYMVVRNGVESEITLGELTVGDKIRLTAGETVPADCAIFESPDGQGLLIDETLITGEPEMQHKKPLMGHKNLVFSNETVAFCQSKVYKGDADCIVLAVGNYSSAAVWTNNRENEQDNGEDNDLLDKHMNILQIFICMLILFSGLLLIQCGIHEDMDWLTSANVALMMFGYGFPYILAIPAIWDKALRNTAKRLEERNVKVQNFDSIEAVASLDYLCIQTISILDKKEDMSKYRESVKTLEAMGIKVVLATGVNEQDARQIALDVGILKPEHAKICGSVIEGSDLRKIYNGRETNFGFDITPEYLSVVYRATAEDRCTLVDYLSKMHPGRITANTPNSMSSDDTLMQQPPVAIVGAVGSGSNDVKMLQKAQIAFSTSIASTKDAMDASDMLLMQDSLEDVVMAVTLGRSYKDHLLKFILMQIPCCLTGIGMVLT